MQTHLKFIKTSLRSTMTETRLNSRETLRLFVHRDRALNYDAIIDVYDEAYPHRMKMSRPLEVERNGDDDGKDEEDIA